ncbi:hypothetical protein CEXT_518591 [Caerostris extrusa]|uniref:Uncharacterized protein n=1 Tax=Caerostris extrusa TaxID=172846 RepID=A0AAV4TYJ9_CAEEX|nr:hypothetical protein CEXT_518591 [Caerostris extrusa]
MRRVLIVSGNEMKKKKGLFFHAQCQEGISFLISIFLIINFLFAFRTRAGCGLIASGGRKLRSGCAQRKAGAAIKVSEISIKLKSSSRGSLFLLSFLFCSLDFHIDC